MELIKLREHVSLLPEAAAWFHDRWGVPLEAYRESMEEMRQDKPVPQWYVALDGDRIVAGLGVIENDFHPRKDLTPNVCAVYTDPAYRSRGLAGKLHALAAEDLHTYGVDTLYLLTDHTGFYERYGWTFLCPVTGDGEETPARMYMHRYQ